MLGRRLKSGARTIVTPREFAALDRPPEIGLNRDSETIKNDLHIFRLT
jgi:hypothetical protein